MCIRDRDSGRARSSDRALPLSLRPDAVSCAEGLNASAGVTRAARRSAPVSYTHLDVYKRQARAGSRIDRRPRSGCRSTRKALIVTYVIALPCVDVKDRACIDECPVDCIYEGERMLYIHPVSYTHLDVYKRQDLKCRVCVERRRPPSTTRLSIRL